MWRRFRSFVQKYFGFSKAETNGFLLLIPLMIVISSVPHVVKNFLKDDDAIIDPKDMEILQKWIAEVEIKVSQKDTVLRAPQLFVFDPNQASRGELEQLGLDARVVKRIIKYRTAGGRFKDKKDLLKIYGISKVRVKEIWDSIMIVSIKRKPRPDSSKYSKPPTKVKHRKTMEPFLHLNQVPSDSLIQIRGIGPVLSQRIVKYRDRLGGFVSKAQLTEVFGLKPEVISNIWKYCLLDSLNVTSIKINEVETKRLSRHPYITRALGRAIVAYRDQHGPFHSLSDLGKVVIVHDSIMHKIGPYLQFE